MQCPRCQQENPPQAKFCLECGAPLAAARSSDPESYTPRHLAEKILTSKAALEGERKLVTVLFCDIANSTALAERVGPDVMHGLLDSFFQIALAEVHRYEGTINQFLGDGFMALFGAPVAHEDHARRAALAALAIPDALQRHEADIQVRIGLNTGLVVVGKIGDNLRMDYTAVGDTTNLAARMQQMAKAGQICLAESTYGAIRQYFECDSVGERRVKGKAQAVHVYQLRTTRSATPSSSEAGIGAPLVGRDGELATIRKRIERLLAGVGGVVSVTGEAGLGKSRLLAEVRKQTREPVQWLEGRGLSFGQTMSYWPFQEIIRAAVGITEQDGEDESWDKLERGLEPFFSDALVEVLPYVGILLGLEVRADLAERIKHLDAQAIGRQIFRMSRRLCERLAQDRPLVLVFEDWHWADESSATLLEHLLPLTESAPLLLCWTARPDPDTPAARLREVVRRADNDRYADVVLSPLSHADSAALVEKLLAIADLPARLRDLILGKAEGNPFFAEEVVRSLFAMGALVRDGQGWRLDVDIERITIPDTLKGVIMARVDRLHEDTKQALRLASVIGRSFLHRILAAMTEAAGELDTHLAHLRELELIREKRRVPELEYIFKHALVQEATYESILLDRRRQLHRRVAECIEALFPDRLDDFSALLAYHYARADAWEKAQAYLFKAGDQAARVAADAEALTQYSHAMAAYARAFGDRWDPQERAILERKIGEALFRRGDHHEAIVHYQRALQYYGTPYPKSRWGLRLAIAAEAIRQVVHRLLPGTLPRTGIPQDDVMARERSRLYSSAAWVHFFVDQERYVLDTFHQLNFSEQIGLRTGIALGSMSLGVVCNLVPLPRLAYRYHQRAVELGEELQDLFAIGNAHLGLAVHESHVGELGSATAHYERAAAAFEQVDAIREWGAAQSSLGHYVSYNTGDNATMQERGRRLIQIGEDAADPQVLAFGLLLLGTAECQIGLLEKSEGHLRSACALLQRIPSYVPLVEALAMLGYCLLRQGKFENAVVRFKEADRVVAEQRLRGAECAHARNFLAEASLLAAERASGHEKTRALAEARRACRVALWHGKIFKGALILALRVEGTYFWMMGKARAGHKRWQRSLAVAESLGARYEAGLTHLEIGRRLAERSSLERAASIFAATGARFDLAVAQRLLAEEILKADPAQRASSASHFGQSIAILEELNAEHQLAAAYASYGRLHKQLGDVIAAREYLTRAREAFERLDHLANLDAVRMELAGLPAL